MLIAVLALGVMFAPRPAQAVEPVTMIVGGAAVLSAGYTIVYRVFINPDWKPHSPADWYNAPQFTLSGRDQR